MKYILLDRCGFEDISSFYTTLNILNFPHYWEESHVVLQQATVSCATLFLIFSPDVWGKRKSLDLYSLVLLIMSPILVKPEGLILQASVSGPSLCPLETAGLCIGFERCG